MSAHNAARPFIVNQLGADAEPSFEADRVDGGQFRGFQFRNSTDETPFACSLN